MRQAGILAACMLTSMEDWREKLTIDNENCSDADAAITTSQGFSVRKCFGAAEFCRFFLFPGVIKVFGVTQRQDAKDN